MRPCRDLRVWRHVAGAFRAPAAVGFEAALRTGFYPFIPADIFKIFAAAAVMPAVWKLVGRRPATPSQSRITEQ